MLVEIAAANAAFQVIKTALSNGKELYDCSAATQSYFSNKSVIAKRVATKGKSDLEAFMALQKIKEQEEWLKDYMIYAGRADMWPDWLAYQAECKRDRLRIEKLAILKKQKIIKGIMLSITVVVVVTIIVPALIYGLMFFSKL